MGNEQGVRKQEEDVSLKREELKRKRCEKNDENYEKKMWKCENEEEKKKKKN